MSEKEKSRFLTTKHKNPSTAMPSGMGKKFEFDWTPSTTIYQILEMLPSSHSETQIPGISRRTASRVPVESSGLQS